jgi:ankyrin repeat protein
MAYCCDSANTKISNLTDEMELNKVQAIPITFASATGNLEAVKILLDEQGVEVETTDEEGETPLMLASFYGNEEIIEFLLSKGADPFAKNKFGLTAIHNSLLCKKDGVFLKYFSHLVEKSGDVEMLVPSQDCEVLLSCTLLSLACGRRCGNPYVDNVDFLIKRGADVNIALGNGITPLIIASCGTNEKIVDLLVQAGANVNAVDDSGRNALHRAAIGCQPEIIFSLCKAGVDANARDVHGATPLHRAATFCQYANIEYLIRFGGADVNVFRNDGSSPLHLALQFPCYRKNNANFKTLKVLLENGCTVETINVVRNSDKKTAYDLAKSCFDYKIANLLRYVGVSPEKTAEKLIETEEVF